MQDGSGAYGMYSSFESSCAPYASILMVMMHVLIDKKPAVPQQCASSQSTYLTVSRNEELSCTTPSSSYSISENHLRYMLDCPESSRCRAWYDPPFSVGASIFFSQTLDLHAADQLSSARQLAFVEDKLVSISVSKP
jgi:hypothetical protein